MPGSDPNETVTELGYGLSLGLISLSPPHGQGTRGCQHVCTLGMRQPTTVGRGTPLVRALAPHGVSGCPGSHLGSTLKPGRAVLTLGVFRRSRSVAYVRADASPSEVHAVANGDTGVHVRQPDPRGTARDAAVTPGPPKLLCRGLGLARCCRRPDSLNSAFTGGGPAAIRLTHRLGNVCELAVRIR